MHSLLTRTSAVPPIQENEWYSWLISLTHKDVTPGMGVGAAGGPVVGGGGAGSDGGGGAGSDGGGGVGSDGGGGGGGGGGDGA
ncbi:MAG: hypothetical protein JRG73_07930 [Deltaproteobacteria bacterium]|nr:hypothetical protein [Deltaproteobacteria bacterium]